MKAKLPKCRESAEFRAWWEEHQGGRMEHSRYLARKAFDAGRSICAAINRKGGHRERLLVRAANMIDRLICGCIHTPAAKLRDDIRREVRR